MCLFTKCFEFFNIQIKHQTASDHIVFIVITAASLYNKNLLPQVTVPPYLSSLLALTSIPGHGEPVPNTLVNWLFGHMTSLENKQTYKLTVGVKLKLQFWLVVHMFFVTVLQWNHPVSNSMQTTHTKRQNQYELLKMWNFNSSLNVNGC